MEPSDTVDAQDAKSRDPVIRYIAWWNWPGDVVRLQGHFRTDEDNVDLFVTVTGDAHLTSEVFEHPEDAVAAAKEQGRLVLVSLTHEIECVERVLDGWRNATDLTFRDE